MVEDALQRITTNLILLNSDWLALLKELTDDEKVVEKRNIYGLPKVTMG